MELSPQVITEDIKQYKIKEGFMYKKSRYLKEWRERWIVLTKNFIYSFEHKQVYTKPTEILPVGDIETLKSYFKQQQQRQHSFRAENKIINFYLAGKTNQEKWAWLSAIQRAVDRNQNGTLNDKQESIQAYRATFLNKEQQKPMFPRASFLPGVPTQISVSKKQLSTTTLEVVKVDPISPSKSSSKLKSSKIEGITIHGNTFSPSQEKGLSIQDRIKQFQHHPAKIEEHPAKEKAAEKVVQRIVEVQKIIEKIVEVRIPVEKIVYVDKGPQLSASTQTKEQCIKTLFDTVLTAPIEFGFFVKFIVSLSLAQKLQFCTPIVKICLFHPQARHFSEALIVFYNAQTDQNLLNELLKFILQIYQKTDEYFYITDLKVLVDILCRQLELYRSELNHYLMLQLIKTLCLKETWPKLQGYRVQDLKSLVEEINNVTPSASTKELTKQLTQYL